MNIGRRNPYTGTVVVSFEAPERSSLQQLRWNTLETLRRGVENRLLDALYVTDYLAQVWDETAPHVERHVVRATKFVTERRIDRWLLAWTLAAVWMCY